MRSVVPQGSIRTPRPNQIANRSCPTLSARRDARPTRSPYRPWSRPCRLLRHFPRRDHRVNLITLLREHPQRCRRGSTRLNFLRGRPPPATGLLAPPMKGAVRGPSIAVLQRTCKSVVCRSGEDFFARASCQFQPPVFSARLAARRLFTSCCCSGRRCGKSVARALCTCCNS